MKKQARKREPLLNGMKISVGAQLQVQMASVVVLVSGEQRVTGMPCCQQSKIIIILYKLQMGFYPVAVIL
jgi:hypothetical protein